MFDFCPGLLMEGQDLSASTCRKVIPANAMAAAKGISSIAAGARTPRDDWHTNLLCGTQIQSLSGIHGGLPKPDSIAFPLVSPLGGEYCTA